MKKILSGILAICLCCTYAPRYISAEETTAILYGDANCDGDVDIRDITAINQHLIKNTELSEQGIKNCDFWSTDTEISPQHLVQLKRFCLKQINENQFNTKNYDFYEKVLYSYLPEDKYRYGHIEIFNNYADFEKYILSFTNDSSKNTTSQFLDKYNEDYFQDYDLMLTTVKFTEYNYCKFSSMTQENNVITININIIPYEEVPMIYPFNPDTIGYFNFMNIPKNTFNEISVIANINTQLWKNS